MSNKIVVTISPLNVPEVKYIFHCLLSEFLGLDYVIIVSNKICNYTISCNSQSLEIANEFFKAEKEDNLYGLNNLPSNVMLSDIEFEDVTFPQATIFGKSDFTAKEDGYIWENDVIAGSFFMLTRWEEEVIQNRDEHIRFMAKDSLAYRFNFLHRPVVNEYVEIIYHILKSFGLDQQRKKRRYKIVPTHDVDRPYLWNSKIGKAKSLAASLLLRRDWLEFKLRFQNIITGKDPYDTFDQLMDMSESNGEKACFFFMSGGTTEFDNYYQLKEKVVIRLIKKIKDRNHLIGIHPSYDTYKNIELLSAEIDTLKKSAEIEILSSRQHYLRFDISTTWNNLEKCNVKWDSTMCYADVAGFRSGVCYAYPTYDMKGRRQLSLLEKPLIVMDTTLQKYEKLEPLKALARVVALQKQVKRYEGEFVFLWHNSSFNAQEWVGYDEVYKSMYNQY